MYHIALQLLKQHQNTNLLLNSAELYIWYMAEMLWRELAAAVPVDSLADEGAPVPLNSEDSSFV